MGSTKQRLLYHFLVICAMNIGDRAFCAYRQYFTVESYPKGAPVSSERRTPNVNVVSPSLTNPLLTTNSAPLEIPYRSPLVQEIAPVNIPNIPLDFLRDQSNPTYVISKQSVSPYVQPKLPPVQEILPVTGPNIGLDYLIQNQPSPLLLPTYGSNNVISTLPEVSSCSKPLIAPRPVAIAPTLPKVSPVSFARPNIGPKPFKTPKRKIVTPDITPSVSYNAIQVPVALPEPILYKKSSAPTILIPDDPSVFYNVQPPLLPNLFDTLINDIYSTLKVPLCPPEFISYTTTTSTIVAPDYSTPLSYNTLPSTTPPIIYKSPVQTGPCGQPSLIIPEPIFVISSEISSPIPYIRETQVPLGPIPFTTSIQSSNLDLSFNDLVDSSVDINVVAPIEIEIETEINTIINNVDVTNVDYVDVFPAVPSVQNYGDQLVPYTLEINIPIVTSTAPALNPIYSLPDYVIPPQIPLVPSVPQYVPPSPNYLPIIIENSKSSSLSTLLLALLATGRNKNCGNCNPCNSRPYC